MTLTHPIIPYARFRRLANAKVLRLLAYLFCVGGILPLAYTGALKLTTFLPWDLPAFFTPITLNISLGIALIGIPLAIIITQFALFLHDLDTRKRSQSYNGISITVEAAQALDRASRHEHISPSKTALNNLSTLPFIAEFLHRIECVPHDLHVEKPENTEAFKTELGLLIQNARRVSEQHHHDHVHSSDLAVACFLTNPVLTRWYQQHNLAEEDVIRLSEWIEHRKQHQESSRRWWSLPNLVKKPPIGLDWIYGFTPVLSSEAEELTHWYSVNRNHRMVGRETEIKAIETALSKSSNANVLLVGPAGVGKQTVIEGLAERIKTGHSPLIGNRMFLMKGETISGLSQHEAVQLLREATNAGNIILCITDIHFCFQSESDPIQKLLQELAQSNAINLIVTTDQKHFHQTLEHESGFVQHFTTIEINEPTNTEIEPMIREAILDFEIHHHVFFTYQSIESLIHDADRYLPNIPFPEKAMDMMETVGVAANQQSQVIITPEFIHQTFTAQFNIPAAAATSEEKTILLNLEEELHKRIVGQNAAVTAVAQSLQRVRGGIERTNKPIGSFLFLGPTGVGKTETAKTLSECYFGSESSMTRFDMSEYQSVESLDRFIGSSQTGTPGLVVSHVRDNPFSVILFDEIEKADRNILNLFLQILDEGQLTDAFGEKVSFRQSIIIATSNAGAEFIRELQASGKEAKRMSELITEHILHQQLFSPELLNRFDSVIVFHPLSTNHAHQIARLQLEALARQLKTKGYLFEINNQLTEHIATLGYDPAFGARPIARAIQNTVETIISKRILADEIQKGVPFTVTKEEIEHITSPS